MNLLPPRCARVLLPGLLAAVSFAVAGEPPVELPRMRFGALTFYSENDKYFAGTDRHYTNGFKLTALSTDLSPALGEAPPWAKRFADLLPSHGYANPGRKLGFALGQNIYTPEDIETPALVPDDRPYAAWLYGALSVHTQSARRLDVFELSLGMVGPAALGRQVQNTWHQLIGVDESAGWSNQIRNEPGLILAYEQRRRWRGPGRVSGFGTDFIPHFGFALGNVATHLHLGGQVRLGWRLPSDFGTSLIRPTGDSATHSPSDLTGWAAHGFAGGEVRAVARNIFLDGNSFRDSHAVDRREVVVDLAAGLAVRLGRFQAAYAQVYRTREFYGQPGRDVFGSLALTWLY